MQSIPLVRANVLAPCVKLLAEIGSPVDRMLREAHLPTAGDAPESLISFQQAVRFAERAADREGIQDLGLVLGRRARIEGLGRWGRFIRHSRTLRDALQLLVHSAPMHTSAARYRLVERERDVLFCYRIVDGIELGGGTPVLFALSLVIDLVRVAAGSNWWPAEIRLLESIAPGIEHRGLGDLGRVVRSPRESAILIPHALLCIPLPRAHLTPDPDDIGVDAWTASAPALEFVDSLKQAVLPLLSTGGSQLHVAAELAGVSVRTFQRRMSDRGTSFSRVIDDVRFALTVERLEEPRRKLIDVALELGYSDPAHFTRAFRRWTGLSPREFRRQRHSGPAGGLLRDRTGTELLNAR